MPRNQAAARAGGGGPQGSPHRAPLLLLLLAVCGPALNGAAQAQATCQGNSFRGSAPAAPMLGTFVPVAEGNGVIVHGITDAGDRAQARLVVENTNPVPVQVRFRVTLSGTAGARTLSQSCVMVRHHQFAVGDSSGIAFRYPTGQLRGVRVTDLRVRELPLEVEWREQGAPRDSARAAADSAALAAGLTTDPGDGSGRPAYAVADEPRVMRAVATGLEVVFGVLLSLVGAMLLVPVLGAAFLMA
ncbi:MAG TPA: hypothetical protein VFQ45_21330, partial [Longimicrobium sp.]|nr:hypothetical protein [Longimicrobium sp.]